MSRDKSISDFAEIPDTNGLSLTKQMSTIIACHEI